MVTPRGPACASCCLASRAGARARPSIRQAGSGSPARCGRRPSPRGTSSSRRIPPPGGSFSAIRSGSSSRSGEPRKRRLRKQEFLARLRSLVAARHAQAVGRVLNPDRSGPGGRRHLARDVSAVRPRQERTTGKPMGRRSGPLTVLAALAALVWVVVGRGGSRHDRREHRREYTLLELSGARNDPRTGSRRHA